jgi:hypothetical protein
MKVQRKAMLHDGPCRVKQDLGYSWGFRWFISGNRGRWASLEGAKQCLCAVEEACQAAAPIMRLEELGKGEQAENGGLLVLEGWAIFQKVGGVAPMVVTVYTVSDVLCPLVMRGRVVSLEGMSTSDLEGSALVVAMVMCSNTISKG